MQDWYPFRTAVDHEDEGTIQVIEIRDLTREHDRRFLACKRTSLPKSPKEKYVIQTGGHARDHRVSTESTWLDHCLKISRRSVPRAYAGCEQKLARSPANTCQFF